VSPGNPCQHQCDANPTRAGAQNVAMLPDGRRETGAQEQATALAARLPGASMFELFLEQQGRKERFGREADGSPSEPWGWGDQD
jgi:hypothetical protein